MSSGMVTAILGLAATCILGGLTVWLALRRRCPGQITYFEDSCIGLFDAIVRNLDDLSIRYKNTPVTENIVLLKGYIMNTGSKDIVPEQVEEPLCMTLPKGFRWLNVKLISPPDSVKGSVALRDPTRAEFQFRLFRVDEHVKFEALAEVSSADSEGEAQKHHGPDMRLRHALRFVHRIADTQDVIKREVDLSTHVRSPRLFAISFRLTLGLLTLHAATVLLVLAPTDRFGLVHLFLLLYAFLGLWLGISGVLGWRQYAKKRKLRRLLGLK